MRELTYCQALNEALHQIMENDESVILIGQGVTSPWYVGNTCNGLFDRFGEKRVIDTPVSENGITGMSVGMAISGMRPILVFPRMDFMCYAMDPIINQAAKWSYMSAGRANVPIVFWAIINNGGCQGPQHSQDFTWLFERIPGLKMCNPQTPYEVKGGLIAAVQDPNPVVFIDHRGRYDKVGEVPTYFYTDDLIKDNEGCPIPTSEPLERQYFERYGQ